MLPLFEDHYQVLGLDMTTATTDDIQNKYDLAMPKSIPENEDASDCEVDRESQAVKIERAHDVLSNAEKRWDYDSTYHEQNRLSSHNADATEIRDYDAAFFALNETVNNMDNLAKEIKDLIREAAEWWPIVKRHIQYSQVYRSILAKARRHLPLLEDLKKEIEDFDCKVARLGELERGMMMRVLRSTENSILHDVEYAREEVESFETFYGTMKKMADHNLKEKMRELRRGESGSDGDVRVDVGLEDRDWRARKVELMEQWVESQLGIEFEDPRFAEAVNEEGFQKDEAGEEELYEKDLGDEDNEEYRRKETEHDMEGQD